MSLFRLLIRPLLFQLDAEWTHRATVAGCETLGSIPAVRKFFQHIFSFESPQLRADVAGIAFKSPVLLAAGFDKNARAANTMAILGFGGLEIGSVSNSPSKGNPQSPRVWRLPSDQALRIYYGCPSDGVAVVAERLRAAQVSVPIGINLVETNTGVAASAQEVIRELVVAVTPFIGIADYLTLNLHCPNIPAGHAAAFDDPDKLALLLKNLGDRHRELPPVFLKFTPSDPQDDEEVDRILDAVAPYGFVKGFILNIPARQPYDLKTPTKILETTRGGLTGPLLLKPTQDAIGRWFSRIDRRRHILIGVGGISSAEDVYETIRRGASLVQLYTAIVYQGPGLVKKLNVGLSRLLERDGFRNIGEAVGAEHRETSPQLSVRRNTA